ncbi:MAG: DUF5107 domain-containing protein, partial [Planctomycetota bacterium]
EYYKVDYSPGTDISRYKNLPVPTSYMAYHSEFNYVGSYDWGREAGLLHVANRHVSPGKKQWTWGHADFGQAWDRHLTDEDGPYIELMCGVFTDNQPDFTWLAPGEQKSFVQHFMPYKGVGRIGDATIDGCVGFDIHEDEITARAYVTSVQTNCMLEVRRHARPASAGTPSSNTTRGVEVLASHRFDGSPARHETVHVSASGAAPHDIEVVLLDATGSQLVAYRPASRAGEPIPAPAREIGPPGSLDSCESLFLAATHLEQYRHATRDPEPYYREALRRDSGDSRCNVGLARLLMARGRPDLAEPLCRAAVERLTRHNPNPATGAAHLQLGLSLVLVGRDEEAEPHLWKATWSEAERAAGSFELARLELRKQWKHDAVRASEAIDLLDTCLAHNAHHHQAAHLRVATLFRSGNQAAGVDAAHAALDADRFAFGVLWELALNGHGDWDAYDDRSRGDINTAIGLALDYAAAAMFDRARAVLERCLDRAPDRTPGLAMVRYHLAQLLDISGHERRASDERKLAAGMSKDLCFPNRHEDIAVLRAATEKNPADALAPFALGNLLYDRRQRDEAIEFWRESARRDPSFATAHRNLGLALLNVRNDGAASRAAYERAFELDPTDARVLYELDQLAKRLGDAPADRLSKLEPLKDLVATRDDLSVEYVALMNATGNHRGALTTLLARRFRPWEGGEGRVPAQFVFAVCRLAERELDAGRPDAAMELLRTTEQWPESLGEGKLSGIQENDIHYLMGLAHKAAGRAEEAKALLSRASVGIAQPTSAMFYNDQPPEMIYFQGSALAELGDTTGSEDRFNRLIAYGTEHLRDTPEIDYFAVSLPDFLIFEPDLQKRNEAHCRLMMALGSLGLGRHEAAAVELDKVLAIDPSNLWAIELRKRVADTTVAGRDPTPEVRRVAVRRPGVAAR